MFALKRRLPALAIALAPLFVACSDSLSPDSVNPEALEQRMSDITGAFDNASFQSVASLSDLFPQFAGVAALRAGMPIDPRLKGPRLMAQTQRRLENARLYTSLRSNTQALFPANVLGKTLVWDANVHDWAIGNQSGAPANGLRIMLYNVDQNTLEPIVAQQLGYLELTDESSPQADRLGVLVTLGNSTVADYVISMVNTTSSLSSTAEGSITNISGSEQVDFDFTETVTNTALTAVADLVGSNGGHVLVQISATASDATLSIAVGQQRNNLSMNVSLDENSDDVVGDVKYNGTVVATIDGTIDVPTFTARSGRTLSQNEVLALGSIFVKAVVIVADVGIAVFAPGAIVFN